VFFAFDACAAFSVNAAAALCFPDEDVDTRRSGGTFEAAGFAMTLGGADLGDLGGFDFDAPDLGGFDFAPDRGGFDFAPDRGGFDFAPDLGGDDFAEPARGGADFGEAALGGPDFGDARCAAFGSRGTSSSSSSHSGFTSIVR
jgi:hypothetical protein